MKINNNWNLIGKVYEPPKRVYAGKNELKTKLILSLVHPYSNEKRILVPILVNSNISYKVANLCRVGDLVYATGEIITSVHIPKYGSKSKLITSFVMSDFMILAKANKTAISDSDYKYIEQTYMPNDFVVPKRRK